jgi:hypothetical protein
MESFFRLFSKPTPAQIAGKKAARAWMTILDQTDEELETLTGQDLYAHAREEARKWLRSTHRIASERQGAWTWEREKNPLYYEPEQHYHEEFLQYVEAFVAAFPRIHRGSPKE